MAGLVGATAPGSEVVVVVVSVVILAGGLLGLRGEVGALLLLVFFLSSSSSISIISLGGTVGIITEGFVVLALTVGGSSVIILFVGFLSARSLEILK